MKTETIEIKWTRHIAGKMIDGVQRCIICGHILIDYRNACIIGGGNGKLRGWDEGDVFVNGNNSTKYLDGPFNDCNSL